MRERRIKLASFQGDDEGLEKGEESGRASVTCQRQEASAVAPFPQRAPGGGRVIHSPSVAPGGTEEMMRPKSVLIKATVLQ